MCSHSEADFVSCLVQLKGKECAARLFVADHLVHTLARFRRIAQFQHKGATLVFPERVFVQGGNPGKPVSKLPGARVQAMGGASTIVMAVS